MLWDQSQFQTVKLLYIFRKQQGSAPYVIEVGGSSYVGMFGYLTAFQEMINQVNKLFVLFFNSLKIYHFIYLLYFYYTSTFIDWLVALLKL